MKRGFVLVGVLLLLAAPMVSAGFFNDFFENLMDRSGSGITGYAISDLLKTVSNKTATTTTPAVTTTPTTTVPTTTTTVTKTTAIPVTTAKTTPTLATLPTATKTATPKAGVMIPSASLALKPAVIAKVKLVKGLFKMSNDLTVSIISVGADKVANAKVEQMIANDKVININEKWYKIKVLENGRIRLTPTEAPKAESKDASTETKAVSPNVLPKVATKAPVTGIKIASTTSTTPTTATKTATTTSTTAAKTTTTNIPKISNLNLGGLL